MKRLEEIDLDRIEAIRTIERWIDRTRTGTICPRITVVAGLVVGCTVEVGPTEDQWLGIMREVPGGVK